MADEVLPRKGSISFASHLLFLVKRRPVSYSLVYYFGLPKETHRPKYLHNVLQDKLIDTKEKQVSELSNINKAAKTNELREFETALRDRLNEANALGEALVYPVAIRTKYCACPSDAETDCRYHPRTEVGWEMCPHITDTSQIGTLKRGRWLYVTTGEPVNQDDPTEAQDKALAERLSNELIKAVQ
jgi:hypothetical protein